MKLPPPEFHAIQKEHEFVQLLLLFQHYKPKRILELGCGHGGSLWAWVHNCPPRSTIVGVSLFTSTDLKDIRQDFMQWGRLTGNETLAIDGRTEAESSIAAARKYAPYDWLHIDAAHRYIDAKADYENYGPMVRPGGIIVFHDIGVRPKEPAGSGHMEVRLFWDELAATHATTQIIDDPQDASCCFGIGVLFKK